jgi:N-acetylmuramoyl-L-alanine amidase
MRYTSLSSCLLFFFLLPLHLFAPDVHKQNAITQLLYHELMWGEKLVFYFDKQPIINRLPSRTKSSSAQEKLVIHFPFTHLSAPSIEEIKERIALVGKDKYAVWLEEVNTPIKGTRLTIEYDPQKILCIHEECDSIQHLKGLIVGLYDKETLKAIAKHDEGLLKVAWNTPPCVIIDPGHGGTDYGAVSKSGLEEKKVTLAVAKNVAELLKKKGYAVYLTRTRDINVQLDERTRRANSKKGDLFISLHANSAPNSAAMGLETYWFDSHLLKPLQHQNTAPELQKIREHKDKKSQQLAQAVHQVLLKEMQTFQLMDRNVRKAVAQVLLGSQMPSILIELGFLSNENESKNLAMVDYQQAMAKAIVEGVHSFVNAQKE